MIVQVELDRLIELGDPNFVDEMVELFVALSARQLSEIRSAIERDAPQRLVQAARQLRGACLGMFASTAAELAEMLERAAKAAQRDPVPELVRRLEVALCETTSQMRALTQHSADQGLEFLAHGPRGGRVERRAVTR
jgi:HPt (histidine-containing phosphotransfer) domain-containing protein